MVMATGMGMDMDMVMVTVILLRERITGIIAINPNAYKRLEHIL